jgi:hypothetical protein
MKDAAAEIHLPWRQSTALVLRRGPFVIASGFDKPEGNAEHAVTRVANSAVKALDGAQASGVASPSSQSSPSSPPAAHYAAPAPTVIRGRYIDLFDAHLHVMNDPDVSEGERRLLLDPAYFDAGNARVIAASGKIVDEHATSTSLSFAITSIEARDEDDLTAIRLLLPHAAKSVAVDGKPVVAGKVEAGTVLLEFPARAALQKVEVTF